MNLLLYFLLAHFLADYPLQPGSLVRLKLKHYVGVFIHGLVHLLVMILILFPFLNSSKIWIGIGIIYLTHNLIDQTKVRLDRKNPEKAKFFYFLDQFLHWTVIIGVCLYANHAKPNLSLEWLKWYTNYSLSLYLLCLVLATYFFDVTRYFLRLKKDSPPYRRDYKIMFKNALIVSGGFGIYWIFSYLFKLY